MPLQNRRVLQRFSGFSAINGLAVAKPCCKTIGRFSGFHGRSTRHRAATYATVFGGSVKFRGATARYPAFEASLTVRSALRNGPFG